MDNASAADVSADAPSETVSSTDTVINVAETVAEPPTVADAGDERMRSPASENQEKASVPSSDDETELEDELEPTPKRNKKSANKKTAQDRLNEDRKKRLSTLLTMESYIHSIFAIIKRETNASNSAQGKEHEEFTVEPSTSAAAGILLKPKGATTPPEIEDNVTQGKYSIEMDTESPVKSKSNDTVQEMDKPDETSPAMKSVVNAVNAVVPTAVAAPATVVASTSQAASPSQI